MSCGCALAAPAGALGINVSCDRHNESRTAGNGRTGHGRTGGCHRGDTRPGEGDTPKHNFQGVAVAKGESAGGDDGPAGPRSTVDRTKPRLRAYGGAFAIRCGGTDGPRVRGNYALRLTNIIPKPRAACRYPRTPWSSYQADFESRRSRCVRLGIYLVHGAHRHHEIFVRLGRLS